MNKWHNLAFLATAVVLVVFAGDVVANVDWSPEVLPGLRVLVVIAAAFIAGVSYVHWESVKVRVPATHATAALGLLGGALAVASVFSSGLDVIFRNVLLASIGVSAIAVSHFLGRVSLLAQEEPS